jgi:hypothetical protein
VLVAQQRPEVTIFRREEDWRSQVVCSLSGAVTFRSIGLELKMEHIYEQAL